ncbi:MAG: class I SAM-dependent methyltransferase [Ginsengibacter sp.]
MQIENILNHVREVYGDSYFFDGKQGYPNYFKQKDILQLHGNNYGELLSKYKIKGKILDVGCAAGFILKGYEQCGWEVSGIEPNDTMAEYGRSKLNLPIITSALECFQSNQKYDVISLIQVIGHFYDCDKALLKISGLLNKEGIVLVEFWDRNSRIAKTMGKYWHEYSPPSVVSWFSDSTLTQLFNYYGFELIGKGRPLKKIRIAHALSLFEESTPGFIYKKKILNAANRAFGKLTIAYPFHDLKWHIFKKL